MLKKRTTREEEKESALKKSDPSAIELDVEVEDNLDDYLDVLEGIKTVEKPDAEVLGHTFNQKIHVIKNLFFKMKFNFECDQEYIGALRMYRNA